MKNYSNRTEEYKQQLKRQEEIGYYFGQLQSFLVKWIIIFEQSQYKDKQLKDFIAQAKVLIEAAPFMNTEK